MLSWLRSIWIAARAQVPEPAPDLDRLIDQALRVATSNIGFGETDANNAGQFIRAIGGTDGMEWCALYVGYCYRRASELLEMPLPFNAYRRPGVPEPGAKALTKAIGAAGRLFTDPTEARPGDVVCWERGTLGWQGHIGLVTGQEGGIIETLEGNTGVFPSKVRALRHDTSKEPRFWRFASLRKESP